MQLIYEPNLIRVNLKLGAVNNVVLENSEGEHMIFNRNFVSTLNNTSEPLSTLMTAKEDNLVHMRIQNNCEDAFLLDKSNKHINSALKKECSETYKVNEGQPKQI